MRKLSTIMLCVILILAVTGCGQNVPGIGESKPVIRGQITKLTQNTEQSITNLLVEGQKEQDTQYDKASVTVKSDTKIFKGNTNEQLKITDLKTGMEVEVYWDGPVAESYPVQMGANIIRVLQ